MKRHSLKTDIQYWAIGKYSSQEAQFDLVVDYLSASGVSEQSLNSLWRLGIVDVKALRNFSIILRVLSLSKSNTAVTFKDIFSQVATEFHLPVTTITSVYYKTDSFVEANRLVDAYIKFVV